MKLYQITNNCEFQKDTLVEGSLCPCDGFKSLMVKKFTSGGSSFACEPTLVKSENFKELK